MSALSPNQVVELSELLSIVLGIAITWAIYHDSEHAELPGEATFPETDEADDAVPDTTGRSLS